MTISSTRLPMFQRALGATLESTALGYAWGAGAGLILATMAHLLPLLRRGAHKPVGRQGTFKEGFHLGRPQRPLVARRVAQMFGACGEKIDIRRLLR